VQNSGEISLRAQSIADEPAAPTMPSAPASLPAGARLFPDEWLLQFDDPVVRIHAVARRYLELARNGALKSAHHIEAALLGKHFADKEGLPIAAGLPNFRIGLSPADRQYILSMFEWLRNYSAYRMDRDAADRAESLGEHFEALLEPGTAYELTDPQLVELQRCLRELRERVTLTDLLSVPRRVRLLQRLDKLELTSKVATLDPLYGVVMEIFVMAQNLGVQGAPMTDLARRVFEIIWMAHAEKDGLGLPPRVVPLPSEKEEDECQIPMPMPLPEGRRAGRSKQ
jgi:hypothetical protein